MSKVAAAPNSAPTVLAIPEEAHVALIRVRSYLRMMAHLTQPGSNATTHDAKLRPDALAWCFSSLSKEIDEIVGATYYSAEIAKADRVASASQKRNSRSTIS